MYRIHPNRRQVTSGAILLTLHAFLSGANIAEAQVNCPRQADQVVIVPHNQPVAFRILVSDLGVGTISVFQYPQGGILEQTGPTPLDFVFVPQLDFRGTTTFTYRLTPPVGCPRGTLLGHVTLAGGNAGSQAEGNATTISGLVQPPEPPSLFEQIARGLAGRVCGLGAAPMSLVTFAFLFGARAHRATRRRST